MFNEKKRNQTTNNVDEKYNVIHNNTNFLF